MRRYLPLAGFVICFAVFAVGLAQLFRLRFEGGDVYPAYSSLRADPLGVMAVYEALEQTPGLEVQRDFRADNRLPEGKNTAYLHLGAEPRQWEWLADEEFRTIEDFVTGGGRLVIACLPAVDRPFFFLPDTDKQETPGQVQKGKKKSKTNKARARQRSLKERWGIEFVFQSLTRDGDTFAPATVTNESGLPLPETLDWHSGMVLTNVSTNWTTIYARDAAPVVVERRFGAGTVVVSTDSYFLSNEALRKSREPQLISWFVGKASRVVFDEAHFGILETEGVATLLRRYRLYGLVMALLFLAGLFIWRNSFSFVPVWAAVRSDGFVAGKDAAGGFVNLLRRNIPRRDLLEVCWAEWKKSATVSGHSASRQTRVEAAVTGEKSRPARERNPVEAYQEVCRILQKKV